MAARHFLAVAAVVRTLAAAVIGGGGYRGMAAVAAALIPGAVAGAVIGGAIASQYGYYGGPAISAGSWLL